MSAAVQLQEDIDNAVAKAFSAGLDKESIVSELELAKMRTEELDEGGD